MWGFARVAPGAEVDFSTQETNLSHQRKGLNSAQNLVPGEMLLLIFCETHPC